MTPTPKQNLALLRLALSREEASQSKLKPQLTPTERKQLSDAGLVELLPPAKRGQRGKVIRLSDRGWSYLNEARELPLSKSGEAAPALQTLFEQLQDSLRRNGSNFSELFAQIGKHTEGISSEQSLVQQVQDTYAQLRAETGLDEVRVRDLKGALPRQDEMLLDYLLLGMVAAGRAHARQSDDPLSLDAADHAAALNYGNMPRHFIKLV